MLAAKQRMIRFRWLMLVLAVVLALAASGISRAQDDTLSAMEFRADMRELWQEHIVWTRLYIISAVDDLPDVEFAAQRLLRNQDDIGDAVAPFYGDNAAGQLSALLRDHILRAADLVTAAKAGDSEAVEAANTAWYANADDIAVFLNGANPDHWQTGDIAHEMHMHLDLTLKEAQARLAGDYEADIAAYDEIGHHILHMADVLSQGIIDQFPERFAG